MLAPLQDAAPTVSAAALVLLGWTVLVVVTSCFALARALLAAASRGDRLRKEDLERVVVLRPCAGQEPQLEASLASTASLQGVRRASVIFGVAQQDDPATAIAERVAVRLRAQGVDCRVLVTHAQQLPNRKCEQLAVMLETVEQERDLVLIVDSDVDLAGQSLATLVAPLTRDAETGAVWLPVVEVAERTAGDRASMAVLTASLHAFPLLAQLGDGTVVGKVLAVRRQSLSRVGGFRSLAHFLGEDAELARRLRERGERVAVSCGLARSLASDRPLDAVVARFARWLTVLRAQRPWLLLSYPLLFTATPLLVVGHALLWSSWSLPSVLAVLATRASVGIVGSSLADVRVAPRSVAWWLLGDTILLLAWARALSSTQVAWRGRELEVTHRGRLVERLVQRNS